MRNRNKRKVAAPAVLTPVLGVAVALVTTVILLIASALCISNEYFSIEMLGVCCRITQLFRAFLASVFVVKSGVEHRERIAIAVGVVILLLDLCCAFLFFDGVSGQFGVNALMTVLGIFCGILAGRYRKRRTGSRNKTRHH